MADTLHPFLNYFKFLAGASNQHGVHSPFVYNFITKCLYDQSRHSAFDQLNDYRKSILSDQSQITITDYGSGSRVFKSETRKVATLGKKAGASWKRMRLLYRVAEYFKPEYTLELGTSLGLATAALALGSGRKITTVEGCPEIAKLAQSKLSRLKTDGIQVKTARFSRFIKADPQNAYDLIYIDGNHTKDATLYYFEKLLATAHNDSVWIFDDIYWSPGMTAAWEEIRTHPKVQVTVDCYWLGFVFFRREQEKQDFKIRL